MSQWIWSPEHNDHYFVTYDAAGQPAFKWAKQQKRPDSANYSQGDNFQSFETAAQPATQAVYESAQATARPPDPVPDEVRQRQPNFIAGTPAQGWYEHLDSSYRMRTGTEARDFFRVGRVFSMLFTEAAGATSRVAPDDEAFTVVRFGELAHTQIRRFVIVSSRRNFVHACAISTYRNQGTFKKGCDPSEHALVYNRGVDPESCYFLGEKEKGLTKEPIEVFATDSSTFLTKESRIRFGKIYSIEWNVKVKDIGMVVDEDLGTLRRHHETEMR